MPETKYLQVPFYSSQIKHGPTGKVCPWDGYIYVIVFEANVCKIGRSSHPGNRIRYIQIKRRCCAKKAHYFSAYPMFRAEQFLVDYYEEYRIQGREWFKLPDEEIEFLFSIREYKKDEFITHPTAQ
jgi:hypothetical protein